MVLRELPAPSELMMTSQQTIVRLELIHSLAATDIPSEYVCVCEHACACVCVCVCEHVCVCICVHVCVM